MRKLIIILMLLSIPLYGQIRNEFASYFGTATDYIASTAADTTSSTSPFPLRELMSWKFWAADTSGDDSVNVKFYFETCSDYVTLQDWYILDSLTVTNDSTWNVLLITDQAVVTDGYGRVRAVGQTGNKKDSSVLLKARKLFKYVRR